MSFRYLCAILYHFIHIRTHQLEKCLFYFASQRQHLKETVFINPQRLRGATKHHLRFSSSLCCTVILCSLIVYIVLIIKLVKTDNTWRNKKKRKKWSKLRFCSSKETEAASPLVTLPFWKKKYFYINHNVSGGWKIMLCYGYLKLLVADVLGKGTT